MPNNIEEIRKALADAIEKKNKSLDASRAGEVIKTVGQDLVNALAPVMAKLLEQSNVSRESLANDLKEAIRELKIEVPEASVNVNVPDIYLPEIKVPPAQVNVKVPDIRIPDVVMPKEMDIRGWVQLQGIDLNNPLPVQLRDKDGRPVNLFENLTTLIGQGGGGAARIVKIGDIQASAFASLLTPDGRVKVDIASGSTGLTDAELRASAVPVSQVSGAGWSVYANNPFGPGEEANALRFTQAGDSISSVSVKDIFGTTAANVVNGDGRIKVSVESGATGLTDTELRASSVPVEQVSGSNWSVYATNPYGQGDTATALRVVVAGNSDVSVSATQVGTWNIGTVTTVTGITNSVAASLVDSTGVQYSGSNPVPVNVGGTPQVQGTVANDSADADNPVKVGGVARTSNPTPVTGGDRVNASYDDLGRQLTRPIQARDLVKTAYTSLTNGTEATLLAAVAGSYLDLVYLMGANNSDVAVTVDLSPVTAGNVVMTLQIPANGTAGIACPIPLPQGDTGNNWTADLPDITGTTVYLTALFSTEI